VRAPLRAGLPYGLAVDWWSLGTLLFEMLSGLPPFYDSNLHVMYEKIVRGKLHMPAYLSPSCQNLLYGLLERDPKRRLGYANDGEELRSHPWFASIDWQVLYDKRIPAPFRPKNVGGVEDTQNVDDEFKRLPAADTPSGSLRTKIDFEGFTYMPAGSQASGGNHLSSALSPGNPVRGYR
jgi:serine/threonine protein kinase